MASDQQVRLDVMDNIARASCIETQSIAVAVDDGVATLTGRVAGYSQLWGARQAARGVRGVKSVAIDMTVELPQSHRRADADLERVVQNVLWWTGFWRHNEITVSVTQGWVTLSGEAEWDFQKRTAVLTVHDLQGIAGVTDNIVLRFAPLPHAR